MEKPIGYKMAELAARANSLLKLHENGHISKADSLKILKRKRYLLLGFSIFLNGVFTSR